MRTLVLTALGVAIVAAGAAAGQLHAATIAETSIGDRGTFLFAGQATFPIALSNPPPIDGLTPAGTDGLDAVVKAGVTLFRVGPPTTTSWSSWPGPDQLAYSAGTPSTVLSCSRA